MYDWLYSLTMNVGARKEDNVVVRGVVETKDGVYNGEDKRTRRGRVLIIFNQLAYSLCANHVGA